MRRLLTCAARWFGPETASRVFEPLLADWDREWAESRGALRVRIGGAFGFLTAVLHCTARELITAPPARAGIAGAGAFAFAVVLSTIIMAGLQAYFMPYRLPLDVLLMFALPSAVSLGIAPAMLPGMLTLRRDASVRWPAGAQFIVGGILLSLACLWLVEPIVSSGYLVSTSQNERIYQLAVKNDRAGRLQYPGTVYRQLQASTPEQRAERLEQSNRWTAARRATRPQPPATAESFVRRYSFTILIVAFGLMGWALGGLRRPTLASAVGWWAMTWLVLFVPTIVSRFSPFGWRPPYWLPTLLFGLSAVGLLLSAARRSTDQINSSPDHQIDREIAKSRDHERLRHP